MVLLSHPRHGREPPSRISENMKNVMSPKEAYDCYKAQPSARAFMSEHMPARCGPIEVEWDIEPMTGPGVDGLCVVMHFRPTEGDEGTFMEMMEKADWKYLEDYVDSTYTNLCHCSTLIWNDGAFTMVWQKSPLTRGKFLKYKKMCGVA